jgi:hypothetical protein
MRCRRASFAFVFSLPRRERERADRAKKCGARACDGGNATDESDVESSEADDHLEIFSRARHLRKRSGRQAVTA